MRALVQRVSEARVTVDGRVTGEIGRGLLILVCAMQTDSEAQSLWLARKVVNLRIATSERFKDREGNPLEYSVETARLLLKQLPELVKDVIVISSNIENFRVRDRKELEGN